MTRWKYLTLSTNWISEKCNFATYMTLTIFYILLLPCYFNIIHWVDKLSLTIVKYLRLIFVLARYEKLWKEYKTISRILLNQYHTCMRSLEKLECIFNAKFEYGYGNDRLNLENLYKKKKFEKIDICSLQIIVGI